MRCKSRFSVPAVRGQKGKDGKPLMVPLACNVKGDHSIHANEVADGKPIRFTWLDADAD